MGLSRYSVPRNDIKPIYFQEFKIKTPETLPSENYTYPIRSQNGADGFARLLHTVWKYGEITKIDTEGQQVKEIRGAIVVVENESMKITIPEWLEQHQSFGVTRESVEQYARTQFSDIPYRKKIYRNTFTFERPRDYSYLYAELLFAFPRPFELERFIENHYKKKGISKNEDVFIEHILKS